MNDFLKMEGARQRMELSSPLLGFWLVQVITFGLVGPEYAVSSKKNDKKILYEFGICCWHYIVFNRI